MILSLELKKAKRTGFFPAFLLGGFLAAAVPILNMSLRWELFASRNGSPVQILMEENWQMMAMLNILLLCAESCLLYHTEHSNGAMGKMRSLPIREHAIFAGKALLVTVMYILVLAMEATAVSFCASHWFGAGAGIWIESGEYVAYSLLLAMPCGVLSLLIASAFSNLWTSLGICVICVFAATMVPMDHFLLSLFPFALPFQILPIRELTQAIHYAAAASIEVIVISVAKHILIKARRAFT